MITKYQVIDNEGNEIEVLNSEEEAYFVIQTLLERNPHSKFEVKTFQVSSVKRGFGRDPDLH